MRKVVLVTLLVTACVFNSGSTQVQTFETDGDESNICPTNLWFSLNNETCQCGKIPDVIKCKCSSSVGNNCSLLVEVGYCMTWNGQPVLGACPYFATNPNLTATVNSDLYMYDIPTNIHGRDLDSVTCGQFNRKDVHCQKCVSGHGPAIFSDSVICADCSKYRGVWFVHFLLQLLLETVLFIVLALLNLKTNRVFILINILTFFWQIILYGITMNSTLYGKLLSRTNSAVLQFLLTIYGIWNLDFIRYLMPPMCITSTTKAINTILFDLVIVLYPFMLNGVLLLCIRLHSQNNQIFAFMIRPLGRILRRDWNPKDSIVSTFTIFFVLGYSKLLFTSLKLFYGVHVYNKNGTTTSNKPILFYDPSVKYLSLEHIPYIIASVSILVIFVFIPPLLLLLYPIRFFRKCINYLGFQRSEILCKIVDTFQGNYKNGTEGTFDYRQFSALYMILRIGIACEYMFVVMIYNNKNAGLPWAITGLVLIGFGALYFTVEPFRVSWMNKFDGFILTLLGLLALTINFNDPFVYIIALVISLKPWGIIGINFLVKLLKWIQNTQVIKETKRKLKGMFARCMKCGKRNNEEEEPLLEESMSDMPDRVVNPTRYIVPELHITGGGSTQGHRSMNIPTYGVV